jgi:hypothetical protein
MATSLLDMVGEEIGVKIPWLNPESHVNVILESVESAGIWINSKQFNEEVLSAAGIKASLASLSLFVPFAKIDFVIGVSQLPHLSEESLGGSRS